MIRLPNLIRTAAALAAGLLLLGGVAAPASAAHPELAPTPFEADVMGEDGCTYFMTSGEAAWPAVHPPEQPTVEVAGRFAILATPGAPEACLPVIPFDRHIEFTAYIDEVPVAERLVPMDLSSSSLEYDFSLAAPDGTSIDHLTVAICQERRADGSSWPDRCGAASTVKPGGAARDDYCRFAFAVTAAWGSGYVAEVTITAVAEAIDSWHAVVTFPADQRMTFAYNAEASQRGSIVNFENASWNHRIPVGASVTFGFGVSGPVQPPPEIHVWANGRSCTEV